MSCICRIYQKMEKGKNNNEHVGVGLNLEKPVHLLMSFLVPGSQF